MIKSEKGYILYDEISTKIQHGTCTCNVTLWHFSISACMFALIIFHVKVISTSKIHPDKGRVLNIINYILFMQQAN
jgi:hypothetical protein